MQNFQQLSLAVALDDQATFDNFYAPTGTPQFLAAHCSDILMSRTDLVDGPVWACRTFFRRAVRPLHLGIILARFIYP